ncbi:solute carrier family 35 member F2-like isoform X2 [Dysidea avara]|uniref:solute carrier family 35 member F2-like isoform X2 n=1 Tax=Dysidea avara TaxID=196820 RepID=UPI00332619D4
MMKYWDKYRVVILTLIIGQIMALLLSGTGVFSQLLQLNYDVENIACTQTFPNYIALFLTFGVSLACRGDIDRVIREHWWEYILLTILDVEINYLAVLGYQYTTIASNQSILNGFTIVGTVILSLLCLRVQYKMIHYIGMTICIVGVASLFLADSEGNNSSHGRNEILVAQEHIIKTRSITEYLGMLGIFGICISSAQLCILERQNIARIQWSLPIVLCFAGYVGCLYVFYALCPILLKISSATLLSLSILCANIYNLLFGILLFNNVFSPLYLVAFSFILIGLVIYNTRVAPSADKDQSPFTLIYWQSYCNSLWCEWRCVCIKSDPELAPLLNGTGSGVDYEIAKELRSPRGSLTSNEKNIK